MAGLTLKRPTRPRALISLVPMIDVMLILLVFFMVTSTYLNLDMIPAARRAEAPGAPPSGPGESGTVMIRLGADGVPVLRGRAMGGAALTAALAGVLAETPLAQVIVLPSGAATTQALVSVMDAAAQAGAVRLRVVRLEARP
ncbi:ExbD/TolR family protein [Antarcticimicrobium luteum]|uniref:Biopolymer transporter ExbD n=1 Tax=Antarcticimicrobium luteum TaxID=2547397 RepID=A0A4R5VHI6_9RHOB|nr:biopolymer transporter ExbD [Antarcticimicrobium luteum]TDK53030.1 biopolymer transporter ExbD [Antarcticimicrobium luteum]